jgi:ribosomal protein L29
MYGSLTAKLPELATKAEVAELRTETKTEIAELRTETRTEIAAVRTEMAAMRTELKSEAELRIGYYAASDTSTDCLRQLLGGVAGRGHPDDRLPLCPLT